MCRLGGSDHLSPPEVKALAPSMVVAKQARVDAAHKSFRKLSTLQPDAPTVAQACMRPCSGQRPKKKKEKKGKKKERKKERKKKEKKRKEKKEKEKAEGDKWGKQTTGLLTRFFSLLLLLLLLLLS